MKRILFIIILLTLTGRFIFAQQTVKRSNDMPCGITEKYSVLKSDKKVMNGEYKAYSNGNLVAKGNYENGKRIGEWNFYNAYNKLSQTYDYSTNELIFADTISKKGIKYFIEDVTEKDSITLPVKIGGTLYGYQPLIYRSELGFGGHTDFPNEKTIVYTHTFTIDETGQIVMDKVDALAGEQKKTYRLDDTKINSYLMRFTPAMVNNKPVMCQVTIVTISVRP